MNKFLAIAISAIALSACAASETLTTGTITGNSEVNSRSTQTISDSSENSAISSATPFISKSIVSERRILRRNIQQLRTKAPSICKDLTYNGDVQVLSYKGEIIWPFDESIRGSYMVVLVAVDSGTVLKAKMSRKPLITDDI